MTKHPPGQWTVKPHVNSKSDLAIYNERNERVATIFCNWTDSLDPIFPGYLRDAKLIAAAPDLLAVCKEALTHNGVDGDSELADMLRAAIAKATQ